MKELIKNMYRNPVLIMIIGSIIGFTFALCVFFFEDSIFINGQALKPCHICGIVNMTDIFNKNTMFFTWIMLFVVHTGASLGLGLSALQSVRQTLYLNRSLFENEIYVSLALLIIMVIVSSTSYFLPFQSGHYYTWPETPLNHQWIKIFILHAVGILSASCAALGTILTGCICMKLSAEELPEDIINIYFDMKDQMEKYLMISGYILSSGMITMYFFKRTEEEMHLGYLFNDNALAILGLMFTIFMAVTFIPSKMLLLNLGKKIVLKKTGVIPTKSKELTSWVETTKSMEQLLELKFDLLETLKYSIPVLTPILSAILPAFFKK